MSISSNVEFIGDCAFCTCQSLTRIDVSTNNTHYASIDGVLYDHDITTIILYSKGITNNSFAIPFALPLEEKTLQTRN